MAVKKDNYRHLHLMTMNQKGKVFYQLRLHARFGRKTIGCGSDHKLAVNISYEVDDEIQRQISVGDTLELDALKSLVREKLEASRLEKKTGIKVVEKDDLRVLWDKYVDWHSQFGNWGQSTILTRIATTTSLVEACPYQRLEQKTEIVKWIMSDKNRTIKTSKERFKTIVSAIDWCSIQGIIPRRWGIEYRDLLASIKIKGHVADNVDADGNVDVFKVSEVYDIIEAFKTDRYARFKGSHSQYWQYIQFLWLTGCRPSEAIALKWKNINVATGKIKFCENEVNASGRIIKKAGTKTVSSRTIPIGKELGELLDSIKLPNYHNAYVFTNKKGNAISQQALNGVWRTVLDGMGLRYRVPYQLRHSMISYHANNDYPLDKLAVLVGNSADVIREHYLKMDIDRITLPEVQR